MGIRNFLFFLLLLFLNCEIKKNPLAPNGPFGFFNLFLNLSKIGTWSYSDPNPIYPKDAPIVVNVPKLPALAIVKNYSIKSNLPNGLSLNETNGYISGTPLELGISEIEIFANNDFFKNTYSTKLNIAIAGFSYLPTYSFSFGSVVSITPTFSENFNVKDFQFSITPNLPSGVSINKDSGIISGTCVEKKNSSYTVTAITQSNNQFTSSFQLNILSWENEAYLKAPNAESGDNFGTSVSVDLDTIVVGAYAEASNQITITNGLAPIGVNGAINSGAAYVYKRTGNNWANEAYLKAPNTESNDRFGWSVSLSGDTIVIGAIQEDSQQTTITNGTTASADNSIGNTGAAYVFKRTGSTWVTEAYLKQSNPTTGDQFGELVSIAGDTIVVGVREEDSNETTITNGTTAAGNSAFASGAAYVFKRTGTTWTNEAYLKASNSGSNDQFGWSVSISGDTIVVGANAEASNETTITNGTTVAGNLASSSGAAYVFKRTGTTWANEAYLKAPNAEASDIFGTSVSISSDTIVVGAIGEASNQTTITNGLAPLGINGAVQSGAAYVFKRTGSIWANEAYLKAPNAEASDQFGVSASISGDTIVVGATLEDSIQTTITIGTLVQASDSTPDLRAGAVYVFKRTGTTWTNEAYLKAPNAEGGVSGFGDQFGSTVSISGDTIVVGTPNEDSLQTTITNGTLIQSPDIGSNNSGAAYVFRRK